MKIVSTFHPSSAVLSSVKCRLGSRDLEHLVVAKLNRLDVYSLRPHGLQHECFLNVWGKVCSVASIPISEFETRSNIAVMLTHPDPEFIILEYKESSTGTAELVVKKQLSLLERLPRSAEFFNDFLIHPSGKLAITSCYAAKLKVIVLRAGNFAQEFDVSLTEINVLSIAFLPSKNDEYMLAILFIDSQERLQLCAREVDIPNLELSPQLSTVLLPTVIPDRVVPNPSEYSLRLMPVQPDTSSDADDAFAGGVMVVGGKDILLFELASAEAQEKQRGKQKRLGAKLKSTDPAESAQARAKEQERGFRKRKAKASVSWPWNEVTAWCAIDESPSRFLIGDTFGRLSMLSLDNLNECGMVLIPLGETSSPTTLTYLTNQSLYVGSHLGDSQLVQICPSATSAEIPDTLTIPPDVATVSASSVSSVTSSRKGKEKAASQNDMEVVEDDDGDHSKGRVVEPQGTYINVSETYKNIGPIMDAISVDIDGSGQSQIVTCSGGANTGSVNVVRNGADFKEYAFIQGLTGVTQIWSVRATYEDMTNTHLLVSTPNESHLFRINDNGKVVNLQREDTGPPSTFVCNQPTVAFSNFRKRENGVYCNSRLVVQVVPNGAYLLEWDTGLKVYQDRGSWEVKNTAPPNTKPLEIVSASVNASQVALALSGGTIMLLCIEENASVFRELIKYDTKREISAISFMPLDSQKPFASTVSVAYWESNIVEIFSIVGTTLKSKSKSPKLHAVVRSLLLYNFGTSTSSKDPNYHAYLLAGLGDGSVATLSWKGNTLHDLTTISLGRTPVNLTPCEVDGKRAVFAAGNRANVFFCEKNRLANSPIMLKDILAVSKLNTKTFTSALVLVTPTGLSIGSVRNLKKMHIRSSFFGLDNPRKIVHEPTLRAFGVASSLVQPTRIGRYRAPQSVFHLIDDNSLAHLGVYNAEANEEIVSILSFKTQVNNQQTPFFCLGTVIYKDEEIEPTAGRLLIFTAHTSATATKTSSLDLALVASAQVGGVVYSLVAVEGKIVAAVNSSVLLYQFDVDIVENQLPTYSLKKIFDWNHNYMVTALGSFGDCVIAGDQISSVSLLKVTETQLVLQGRDYTPLYPVAVEAMDRTSIIAANDTLNLVLFKLGRSLRGEALEKIGFFHLGELVSKLVRGSLTTLEQARGSKFKPDMVYFTSSGSIGIITDVEDDALSLHLTELQRNLAAVLPGVGGTSHTRFRSPKNVRGPSDADGAAFGFIDGDFLEQFIGLQSSPDLLRKVMTGGSEPERLKLSADDILKCLEQLQNLH